MIRRFTSKFFLHKFCVTFSKLKSLSYFNRKGVLFMSRKPRNFYLSDFYHIMVQGDEKKSIFRKGNYKEKYLYLLKNNAIRNDVKIIAYCIMDNHAHVLVYSNQINRISKMMSQCNTAYGMYYSKKRKNVGHVFRDRYRSEAVYSKKYLINCIKYIHQNPVKANIVKNCESYLYSSFNDYLNKENFLFENIKEISYINENDYMEIISNSSVNLEFLDEEKNEGLQLLFESLKKDYTIDDLTNKQILEIYFKLKEYYNVSNATIAKMLNLKRTTLMSRLKTIKNYNVFVEKGASLN